MAALRSVLLDAVTDDDLRAAVAALVAQARAGDVAAIRELLDRTCGKATLPVDLSADAASVVQYIVGVDPSDV